jgi:hypothetical protein
MVSIFTPKRLRRRVWPTVGLHFAPGAVLLNARLAVGSGSKYLAPRGGGRRGSLARQVENKRSVEGISVVGVDDNWDWS